MFHLDIRTAGAAFDDAAPAEVARLLREVADNVEGHSFATGEVSTDWVVRDINGARVGKAVLSIFDH